MGGIEGVVWTDFAQTLFLIGAALLSFVLIVGRLDGGFGTLVQVAAEHDKLRLVRWSGDHAATATWVVLLGSMFSGVVPFISDQSIIQRYQATTDVPAAGRALWTNAGFAMINTCLLAVMPMASAFDFFQRLLGLTSSGLAGLFLLGIFTRRARTAGALTGAITSAVVLYLVQTETQMHVYLYALTGIGVCVVVGYTVSLLLDVLRQLPPAAGRS